LDADLLISFVGTTALLAISPGPDNIYVLVQSIVNGKNAGMATVSGLISGCIVHTSLLAFGVSAVIRKNDHIYLGIRIFGALYLIYLAYKVYRSSSRISFKSNVTQQKNLLELFGQGFLMNVLNPKVTIFFLAFLPLFVAPDTASPLFEMVLLSVTFMAMTLVIFIIYGLAGQAFEFLFLHQTHHRGQISQILDTLGLPNNLADNAAYLE